MSPSPRASTAWLGLSTGQLAATPASAAAPGLGHGVCIRTPGFLGNSALTTGPPQRAGGCAGEQSHAPHPCSRCLLHSFRLKQHRDACCTLQERARHPIPPCRKSPQNTSSPFEQAHITFQPEEQHSLCRQGPSRKPLWQGHPYHLSQHRVTPAAPCCTTSSATSLFAFEKAHGRELGKSWTLPVPNPGTKCNMQRTHLHKRKRLEHLQACKLPGLQHHVCATGHTHVCTPAHLGSGS